MARSSCSRPTVAAITARARLTSAIHVGFLSLLFTFSAHVSLLSSIALKLSATPSASATGTLAAHLIPSLNLGLSALGDTVSATVFLELDASASMTLSAQAQANASTTVGRRALRYSRDVENVNARQSYGEDDGADGSSSDADDASSDDADEYSDADPFDWDAAYASGANAGRDAATSTADASNNATSTNSATDATMTDSATDAATANSTADTTMTATIASLTASASTASESSKALGASTSASTSFGGCVEIDANLDVNAGATGSFFGLFDATTKVDLFQKKFEIFKVSLMCLRLPAIFCSS
jgi:hypothetical protein